ncbi:uracil-DNA glycosylase [Xinfangfangia sp. D13-10-4-6]|uniref:uracil-DNA glycosylase n=1 Tax=Pseudogemmobacter hezensis TaxID=2737662 RepID=UPI001557B4FC|nr:uracil-DNA glycosylase [Pseudogemmobacter hezensis]
MGIDVENLADGAAQELAAFAASDWDAALAALGWQLDCGIDEVIGEESVNRYDVVVEKPAPRNTPSPNPQPGAARTAPGGAAQSPVIAEAPPLPEVDPVAVARQSAAGAGSLEALLDAIRSFELCDLKRGARNTVFADGNPKARLMILGEAPGREEDQEGRPFVGEAGQLLDNMLAAIGLSRTSPDPATSAYITALMPWRPEGGRDPSPSEIAMMLPFVQRHIALADPDVILVLGNAPLFALTGQRSILRARGQWGKVDGENAAGKPLLPGFHPTYLLRNPGAKREAWADLQSLRAFLDRTA